MFDSTRSTQFWARCKTMDSTTLDDNSGYFNEFIYKQSITDKTQASFVFAGAKAMVATWDKNAANVSNDNAAAAARRVKKLGTE